MKDVVTGARELLEGITPGKWSRLITNYAAPLVYGNGHEVAQVRYWSGSENVAEVERNSTLIAAAPDLVRGLLERIGELERVYVPVGNGSPETLLRLLDENRSLELQLEQAQQERDAALERARVLEQVYEAAKPVAAQWVWSSKASHPNYSSHVWASDHTQLYSAVCKALEPGEELRPRGIVEETPHA